jgi:hypothetical protein
LVRYKDGIDATLAAAENVGHVVLNSSVAHVGMHRDDAADTTGFVDARPGARLHLDNGPHGEEVRRLGDGRIVSVLCR